MAHIQYSIEKLGLNNYGQWKRDVRCLLAERNLWELLDETKKAPKMGDEGVTAESVLKYQERARTAFSIIYLNIKTEFRSILEDCEDDDPVGAWTTIKNHYYPDTRAHHQKLFIELIECRPRQGERVQPFGVRINRILTQLKLVDSTFNPHYAIFQLLRYLPKRYEGITQAIMRWPTADFTFKKVLEALIGEEARQGLNGSGNNNDLPTESHFVKQGNSKNKGKRPTCWRCGKPGHRQDVCRSQVKPTPEIQTEKRKDDKPKGQNRERSPSPQRSRSSSPKGKREYNSDYFVTLVGNTEREGGRDESWLFDTGASHHFCADKSAFKELEPVCDQFLAVAVKGARFPIKGKGKITLKFPDSEEENYNVNLSNVFYAPNLRRNILSGPCLDEKGATFKGGSGFVSVYGRRGNLMFKATLEDGIYKVHPTIIRPERKVHFSDTTEEIPPKKETYVETPRSNINKETLWHRKLGHVSPGIIERTQTHNCVTGLPTLNFKNFECEQCKINKFRRVSHRPINEIRSRRPLELLYADVWGPSQVEGRRGERYFLSIIDDFSRRVALYPIHHKSDVFDIVKRHITMAERQSKKAIRRFRTDNGTEFVNEQFKDFFDTIGIVHERTNVYTPEQNGVAERFNQTVADGARTILSESGLDPSFWPEAMKYFVYTWNRVCPQKLEKTPFELYTGHRPSVKHLKPFGCKAYVGIPRQNRAKLDAKAEVGYLIGYAFRTKGYRIWFPHSDKIVETLNVSFNENKLFRHESSHGDPPSEGDETYIIFPPVEREEDVPSREQTPGPSARREEEEKSEPPSDSEKEDGESGSETDDDDSSDAPLRTTKWRRLARTRPDKSRTDIYFFDDGVVPRPKRVRSARELREYCSRNNIQYNPDDFSFNTKDLYSGPIPPPNPADADANSTRTSTSNLSAKA